MNYTVFDFLETFSPLIPIAGLLIKRPRNVRWLVVLQIYLLLYIPLSAYANYLATHMRVNIVVYLIISAITFCCFVLVIESFFIHKSKKKINRVLIAVSILFLVVNALLWEGTTIFNSNSSALNNFILLLYCLYYYKLQIANPENAFVEKQPSFWIVSGIFIFCCGDFFLYALYNYLTLHHTDFARDYAWYFNDVLITIMNIFFTKGIICVPK